MQAKEYDDGRSLSDKESLAATTMGLVVDYMTRFMLTHDALGAFDIPIRGARIFGKENVVMQQLNLIKGLDDVSIKAAARIILVFDASYRIGLTPQFALAERSIDELTLKNVKIMVERSLTFFESVGPVIATEFTFEGGYTNVVTNADADYLTKNTIWDMKVSVKSPKKEHTLQLILYYLLAKRSGQERFKEIDSLGIFNPRLNTSYSLNVDEVDPEVLEEISTNVLGV